MNNALYEMFTVRDCDSVARASVCDLIELTDARRVCYLYDECRQLLLMFALPLPYLLLADMPLLYVVGLSRLSYVR